MNEQNNNIDAELLEIDVSITKAILDYVNTWSGKPVDITLNMSDKEPPAMMLLQQGSSFKQAEYVDGSFIGKYPFYVYSRINGADTQARLTAIKELETLFAWFKTNEHDGITPNLGENKKYQKIVMTTNPSLATQYDNGYEDYSTTFILTYQFKKS